MKLKSILAFLITLAFTTGIALAFVNCQSKYAEHPRSLPGRKNDCSICHISPSGSGPQNSFGMAFANAGFKITGDLISKFPELFKALEVDTPEESTETPAQPESPVIKRIKPKKVTVNIETSVQIKGTGFTTDSKVFIDDIEVTTTFESSMLLTISFVTNSLGVHTLKIKNSDGQESKPVKLKAK